MKNRFFCFSIFFLYLVITYFAVTRSSVQNSKLWIFVEQREPSLLQENGQAWIMPNAKLEKETVLLAFRSSDSVSNSKDLERLFCLAKRNSNYCFKIVSSDFDSSLQLQNLTITPANREAYKKIPLPAIVVYCSGDIMSTCHDQKEIASFLKYAATSKGSLREYWH